MLGTRLVRLVTAAGLFTGAMGSGVLLARASGAPAWSDAPLAMVTARLREVGPTAGAHGVGQMAVSSNLLHVTWVQQALSASPPARRAASMVEDAATQSVVLFGGCCDASGRVLGDTWTWDGSNWIQQHPARSPPARAGAAMAYDPSTGAVLLFGGYTPAGAYFGDTWLWDGTNWVVTGTGVLYYDILKYGWAAD